MRKTLMISNSNTAAAALIFSGSFAASSDIDLTSTPSPAPAPFTVTSIGAFAAGHQLEIGTNTTLTASSATITGPGGRTIGIQDFGRHRAEKERNADEQPGAYRRNTRRRERHGKCRYAPSGSTGRQYRQPDDAGGAGVVDTFGTTGAGLGLATVSGHWNNQQLTVGHAGTADVVADNGAMITAQGGGLPRASGPW